MTHPQNPPQPSHFVRVRFLRGDKVRQVAAHRGLLLFEFAKEVNKQKKHAAPLNKDKHIHTREHQPGERDFGPVFRASAF